MVEGWCPRRLATVDETGCVDLRWRPSLPGNLILVEHDGVVVHIGVITSAVYDGTDTNIRTSGPDVALTGRPLPYNPPGIDKATGRPRHFHFWWRRLSYIFDDLPNPYRFPSLSAHVNADERDVLERYVHTTDALAGSSFMAAVISVDGRPDDANEGIVVETNFPNADVQAGFAALLRQCHNSDGEQASFGRATNILGRASHRAGDPDHPKRTAFLRRWRKAEAELRRRSARDLMYDKFIKAEGWRVFEKAWRPPPPDELFGTYQYGDLIHWDRDRHVAIRSLTEHDAAMQRFAFFEAAMGLAHLYIGCGEAVRSALADP